MVAEQLQNVRAEIRKACEKSGRRCRMIELDEKYVDVIIKRWEEYSRKKAVHEQTGKSYEELKIEREKDIFMDQKKVPD